MAKVSISEAARLAGVARSNFYTTYIRKGRISVSKDSYGKKYIDTSELLRVFGRLEQDIQDSTEKDMPESSHQVTLAVLETENRMLRDQVSELKGQRTLDREQIKDLNTRLLEYHRPDRQWWQFWK